MSDYCVLVLWDKAMSLWLYLNAMNTHKAITLGRGQYEDKKEKKKSRENER
jgi:hypothetical protein